MAASKGLRRIALRQRQSPPLNALRRSFATTHRSHSQHSSANQPQPLDISALLSKPTWSATSLLPPKNAPATSSTITPSQLHHLLRLSALPPPATPEEERHLLHTLHSHLHFVRAIQATDTTGVTPLRSLRDETAAGKAEAELGMAVLREALEGEEVRGKWHRRVRRRRGEVQGRKEGEEEKWDVLGQAGRTTGRYFVVEGGKKKEERG